MPEEVIKIEGGMTLRGEVRLSGAKNAILPMLVAACLGEEPTVLENVPIQLNDVRLLIGLLKAWGAQVEVDGNQVSCARGTGGGALPEKDASSIRYSLLLLGLAAATKQEVFLPQPGGCKIGDRKYDLHLMGLRQLGADIREDEEGITLKSNGLRGSVIDFYLPTTSGTENIMIAAVHAEGITRIRNANTRPEVEQLGHLLKAMGAEIEVRNRIVEIQGVERLRGGARMAVMPGWDEALTYMIAAGATGGEIAIRDFSLAYVKEDVRYMQQAGVEVFEWQNNVYVSGKHTKRAFDLFTAPYPGVNSDMQPIFAALALTIPGSSSITDLRFTDRFQYVEELKRFGGDIEAFGNTAVVQGGKPLTATKVTAPDLRGGMACVMCGLVAHGETTITNKYQIERGYENFVEKFAALGANIRRVTE